MTEGTIVNSSLINSTLLLCENHSAFETVCKNSRTAVVGSLGRKVSLSHGSGRSHRRCHYTATPVGSGRLCCRSTRRHCRTRRCLQAPEPRRTQSAPCVAASAEETLLLSVRQLPGDSTRRQGTRIRSTAQ